jgi:hypothetical protein
MYLEEYYGSEGVEVLSVLYSKNGAMRVIPVAHTAPDAAGNLVTRNACQCPMHYG